MKAEFIPGCCGIFFTHGPLWVFRWIVFFFFSLFTLLTFDTHEISQHSPEGNCTVLYCYVDCGYVLLCALVFRINDIAYNTI